MFLKAAGRDPSSIRRVYNLMGSIGPTTGERFVGPVSYWVEELTDVAQAGMDAFIFWPGGDDPVGQAEAFASDVAPAVRVEAAGS